MRLSVVIPTLNEAASLAHTVAVLRARTAGPPVEVIVADCGSRDGTVAVATACGARLEAGPALSDRARACNAGAAAATGDVLLFLHADTLVPRQYDLLIRQALLTPRVVGGAFEFALDGPQWRLRFVELVNRLRYRVRGRFFGDQGIFIRRDVFQTLGGFPQTGILEDAHLCAIARRAGTMPLLGEAMLTSPRRFYRGGILRTLVVDALILASDLLGLNPERFAHAYRRENVRRDPATGSVA
jgi:rSAM/selenodomain-associated transferase 2